VIELVGSPALQAMRTVTGQPRAPALRVGNHLWDSAPLGVPNHARWNLCPHAGGGSFRLSGVRHTGVQPIAMTTIRYRHSGARAWRAAGGTLRYRLRLLAHWQRLS
jgi:hypothetical protein